MTFDQCTAAYIASHSDGWRNAKHAAQRKSTLSKYASPVFGALPVQAVDVALVLKAVEPIGRIPETAGRVRGRIEAVLDWARSRGLRSGECREVAVPDTEALKQTTGRGDRRSNRNLRGSASSWRSVAPSPNFTHRQSLSRERQRRTPQDWGARNRSRACRTHSVDGS
jgi:hypothetical protein